MYPDLWRTKMGVTVQLRNVIKCGHKQERKENPQLAGSTFFALWFVMQVKEGSCKWQITF